MKDEMIYAEKLSRMIQVETISEPDVPNTEKFDAFHTLLEELFPTVINDGALPRKTFSMGHAEDKRFYAECRKITE